MFEIVLIVASRVLVVLLGFWLYRKLSSWHGFKRTLIGRNNAEMRVGPVSQKGFVRLRSAKGRKRMSTKPVKIREVRAPWGW